MAAAVPTGDIFLVGIIRFTDPNTKEVREENCPQINLSQFIRNMKFPQRVIKKPAARNSIPRSAFTKIQSKDANTTQTQANISAMNESETTLKIQKQNLAQQNPTVSSNEKMLERAIKLSMKESSPARTIDNLPPEKPNFNTVSEVEQMSMTIKMSMPNRCEHDYAILA